MIMIPYSLNGTILCQITKTYILKFYMKLTMLM